MRSWFPGNSWNLLVHNVICVLKIILVIWLCVCPSNNSKQSVLLPRGPHCPKLHLLVTSNAEWSINLLTQDHRTPLVTEAGLEALSVGTVLGTQMVRICWMLSFYHSDAELPVLWLLDVCPRLKEGWRGSSCITLAGPRWVTLASHNNHALCNIGLAHQTWRS